MIFEWSTMTWCAETMPQIRDRSWNPSACLVVEPTGFIEHVKSTPCFKLLEGKETEELFLGTLVISPDVERFVRVANAGHLCRVIPRDILGSNPSFPEGIALFLPVADLSQLNPLSRCQDKTNPLFYPLGQVDSDISNWRAIPDKRWLTAGPASETLPQRWANADPEYITSYFVGISVL